jgi:hypothetical protein
MDWDEEKGYIITPAMARHIRRTRRLSYLAWVIWTVMVFELGFWIGHLR